MTMTDTEARALLALHRQFPGLVRPEVVVAARATAIAFDQAA